MTDHIPTTLDEALDQGYRLADMQYTKGYLSRKTDLRTQPVHIAGGNRKGDLYIEEPCWNTSKYHFRHYLVREEN